VSHSRTGSGIIIPQSKPIVTARRRSMFAQGLRRSGNRITSKDVSRHCSPFSGGSVEQHKYKVPTANVGFASKRR
jgi:hypothetical protein